MTPTMIIAIFAIPVSCMADWWPFYCKINDESSHFLNVWGLDLFLFSHINMALYPEEKYDIHSMNFDEFQTLNGGLQNIFNCNKLYSDVVYNSAVILYIMLSFYTSAYISLQR